MKFRFFRIMFLKGNKSTKDGFLFKSLQISKDNIFFEN